MKFTITGTVSQVLNVQLAPGDVLKTASGRLVGRSFAVDTKARDGTILSGIKRMLSDTSVEMEEYCIEKGAGMVTVGPAFPGMIMDIDVSKGNWVVQKCGLLACTHGVSVAHEAQKHICPPKFGPEGLVLLRLSGEGTAFIASCGDFTAMELRPDDRYTVATAHALAWESSVKASVHSVRNRADEDAEDDEYITDFKGPGRIVIQNLCEGDIASAVVRFAGGN